MCDWGVPFPWQVIYSTHILGVPSWVSSVTASNQKAVDEWIRRRGRWSLEVTLHWGLWAPKSFVSFLRGCWHILTGFVFFTCLAIFCCWQVPPVIVLLQFSSGESPFLSSVQFSSVPQSCLTLCDPMDCSTPGFPVHHQLPEFSQTYVHWVGDAIQPSYPLSSPSPAFNLSQHQGLFKWVSSSHQVAKVWEFQLQHPSNEYSGLISFRMDWLDLLTVQGTLKSLLQHHISKASIFGTQLSL